MTEVPEFPRPPAHVEPYVRILGLERALAQPLPAFPAGVPVAKPWLAACLRAQGQTVSHIARHLRVTDVTVRNWLRTADQRAGIAPWRDPSQ